MRAAGNALRTAGLRRGEVLQIARRHPPVLGRDPALLINLILFLRFNCGLHKVRHTRMCTRFITSVSRPTNGLTFRTATISLCCLPGRPSAIPQQIPSGSRGWSEGHRAESGLFVSDSWRIPRNATQISFIFVLRSGSAHEAQSRIPSRAEDRPLDKWTGVPCECPPKGDRVHSRSACGAV